MRLLLAVSTAVLAIAALLAPVVQADPPKHVHDYLAAVRQHTVSAVPPDVRDHAEVGRLVALYGNPSLNPRSSFSWSDAGIGAGATAGGILILSAATALTLRRRVRLAL